eukprot:7874938-Pyramimonas_sp.AAC.1
MPTVVWCKHVCFPVRVFYGPKQDESEKEAGGKELGGQTEGGRRRNQRSLPTSVGVVATMASSIGLWL